MTLTINLPKYKTISQNDLKSTLENMLAEYSEFDLCLLKRYYETVNLPDSHFINIQ